jgi:predicted dehydrogenase
MLETDERIGVGIVGIGFGRAVHLPALRADPRVEVVAIAASTAERAEKVASECGITKAYGDWRQMVADPAIQAVTIAVPPHLQAEIALAALHARKHVFCEKPLADSDPKAAMLVNAALDAEVANLVDFEFPAVREWKATKQLLESDTIGTIRHVHVNWHVETYAMQKRLQSWKTNLPGGGMLMSFVSHCFHYLPWFVGQTIVRLRATLHRDAKDPGNADTINKIELYFSSGAYGRYGAYGTITASCNAPGGSGHRVEIYGDRGSIILENRTREYLDGFTVTCTTRDGPVPVELEAELAEAGGSKDSRVRTVAVLIRRFVDWIESGVPAGPNFREGLRVQKLIDAARQSHAALEWIETPENLLHA